MGQKQLPCKNCITLAMCKALTIKVKTMHSTQRGLSLPDKVYMALYKKCSLIRLYTTSVYMEEGLKTTKIIDHDKKNEVLTFFKILNHKHKTKNRHSTLWTINMEKYPVRTVSL